MKNTSKDINLVQSLEGYADKIGLSSETVHHKNFPAYITDNTK